MDKGIGKKLPADYRRVLEQFIMEFLPEPHDFTVEGQGWNTTVRIFNNISDGYCVYPDVKWKTESDLKGMAKRIVQKYLRAHVCDKIVNDLKEDR